MTRWLRVCELGVCKLADCSRLIKILNILNILYSKDEYYDSIAKESWSSCRPSDSQDDCAMEDSTSDGKTSSPAPTSAPLPFNADKKKSAHFACKSTNPPVITPGHTGFLTFATLFPTIWLFETTSPSIYILIEVAIDRLTFFNHSF